MLSEKVITTLGNSDYRLKSFEKYSLIDKPKWKRVGHQVEEPAEFKPFNNISLQNEVQEGLIVKNIDESLTEIARLSNDKWQGWADFLIKVACPSNLGNWSYEAIDTKLSTQTRD